VNGLNYVAGNGANTRGIINSKATLSTLTIDTAGTFTYGNGGGTNPAGNITGNVAIVKNGAGTQTIGGAINSYTGNVTVNGGTLIAGGNAASTALGSPTTAGRTVTVNNSGSTLSFTTNNVFGNGIGNANLPAITLNAGTTLTSTRYNVLGPVTLNGATLTQSTTDSGNFEGFQFKGPVTVAGVSASTISTGNIKANHLDTNTVFTVADATGDTSADLTVSAPLRNQSNDFGSAAGGLTKAGLGTMLLSATNTYTGPTIVDVGTLIVNGSISGSATTVNASGILGGTGTLGAVSVIGGTVVPGASPGTLTTSAFSLNSAATLKFELAQSGVVGSGINDLISVGGSLTLDGTLEVTALPGFGEGTYRLFDYTGALTNNGLDLPFTFLTSYPGSFVDASTANQINLVVVPEPSAFVAFLGGCGVLLAFGRARRRQA
jgi:fibronectin-binding autotransporter adhesin